jgi:hypothetical protein
VEVGQLVIVAAAFLAYRLLARQPNWQLARTAALYGIGTVAAYWSISRIALIVA